MQSIDASSNERDTHAISEWLQRSGSVYMIGIGGIGMAGLAYLLHKSGLQVSGSDCSSNALTDWLKDQGICVYTGHAANQISETVSWCVRSTAVPENNDELQACHKRGIPVFMRGAVLAAFMNARRSIAVSGTHGKTSTTAMLRHVLQFCGVQAGWFVGGEMDDAVVADCQGELFVAEADESDGTVALYHPEMSVITNIEFDHMEHFDSREHVEECFRCLIDQTKRTVVYCMDDPAALRLCGKLKTGSSYGFSEQADVRGVICGQHSRKTDVMIYGDGAYIGQFELPLYGEHNVLNALGVFAALVSYGISFEQYASAMREYQPVKRRFERCGTFRGALVISDYAHHPTEIKAVIQMAKMMKPRKLYGIFQPHRYTRTLALRKEYLTAFDGLDELVLCPVYAASEEPIEGGRSTDLHAALHGVDYVLDMVGSLHEVWPLIAQKLTTDDIVLVIGAGDVDSLARQRVIEHIP